MTTAEQLRQSGVSGTRDLKLVTPGLNITLFGPYVQPTIRGVGTSVLGVGADSNVATYIDGVYQASQIAALFEFDNIERIETLKGPQGSLYGRNATGGAIVVTTREPSLSETKASAELSYGSFEEVGLTGYVNLPLTDHFAANIAAYSRSNDGYTTNVFNGKSASETDSSGVRARLLFDTGQNFRAILSGTHIEQDDNTALSYSPFNGNTPTTGTQAEAFGLADHSRISHNVHPESSITYDSINLNGTLEGEWGSITSITSWTKSDTPFHADQDGTEVPVLAANIPFQQQETITQEFTYASPEYDRFSWIGGLYYLTDQNEADFFVSAGLFSPTAFYPLTPSILQDTTAWAAYAEGKLDLTRRLHLTVGGRYSQEDKHAQYHNGPDGFLMLDADDSWDSFTPRAALTLDLTSNSTTYVSYSEGFKSGLFDALNTGACVVAAPGPDCPSAGTPVDPESVKAYELGYKYNAGGSSFSAAAFFSDYSDIQMTGRDGLGNLLLYNAASAEIYGLEVEFGLPVNDIWSLHGGGTYTHGEYTDFPGAQDWTPLPAGGNARVILDASGNDMIRTPENTAFLGLNYDQPLEAGSLHGSLTASYSSSYFWDPSNRLEQPANTIVNARLSWLSPSERFRYSFFGNNLTDEETMLYVRSSTTGDLVSYSKPRSWGVSLSFNY